MKKKGKNKKPKRRNPERAFEAHRRKALRVLEAVGLEGAFYRQPATIQRRLLESFEVLKVEPDRVLKRDSTAKRILRQLDKAMNLPSFLPDIFDESISLYEFLGVWLPVLGRMISMVEHNFGVKLTSSQALRLSELQKAIDTMEILEQFYEEMNQASLFPLVENSAMDTRFFWLEFVVPEKRATKRRIRLVLRATPARKAYVVLDGERRLIYRCAEQFPMDDVAWIQWPRTHLPRTCRKRSKSMEFDVFIQSHALRRMSQRLDVLPQHLLHYSLGSSLADPVFAEEESDIPLVELRLGSYRLGYLPVEIVGDKAVALTFLFLPMDGTPEGKKLKEKLRISRKDLLYLELDKLSTFIDSDVLFDEQLRELFKECGCDDIYQFGRFEGIGGESLDWKEMLAESPRKDRAQAIRKMFGVSE